MCDRDLGKMNALQKDGKDSQAKGLVHCRKRNWIFNNGEEPADSSEEHVQPPEATNGHVLIVGLLQQMSVSMSEAQVTTKRMSNVWAAI